ncbi:MAG: hypothetical protein KGP28_05720 [Bdellovibrionales bacterium]|nr:hypothetical protein [Bdellovibrionales bacterium]
MRISKTLFSTSLPILSLLILSACGLSVKKLKFSDPSAISSGTTGGVPKSRAVVQFGNFTTTDLSEAQGAVSIPVSLNAASTSVVSIPYTVSGVASTSDHNLVSGLLTFPAGSVSNAISFNIINDTLNEDPEDLFISLGTPENADLGSNSTLNLRILDNDPVPSVNFTQIQQSFMENAGPMNLVVNLSAASSKTISVSYSLSGTATQGSDYSVSPSTLTFQPGQTSQNIQFTPIADGLMEAPETVVLTLVSPTNAVIGGMNTSTITIQDVALTSRVAQFPTPTLNVTEAGPALTVTLNLNGPASAAISVPFSLSGSALQGSDYSMSSTSFSFAMGSSSASVTLTPVNDTMDEPDETVTLTLGTPVGPATLGSPNGQAITITDNDSPPVLSWQSGTQSLAENVGSASIVASLSSASAFPVSATYTFGGTAVRGTDYTAAVATGTVTIPAGALTSAISLPILDNMTVQGSRTVTLALSAPNNATLGNPSTHTLTITDNDTLPLLQFTSSSMTVNEGVGSSSVSVSLGQALSQPLTVNYTVSGTATNPGDHNLSSGSLTIPANSTTASIPFSVVNDTLAESAETIVLTLGSAAGTSPGPNQICTVTIADNDSGTPSVSLATSSSSVSESVGVTNVNLSLSSASANLITVVYSVSGTYLANVDAQAALDFSMQSMVSFLPGSTSASISIPIIDDNLRENAETIVLTLQPAQAGQYTISGGTTHTITITDNDQTPSLAWTSSTLSVSEAIGEVTVTAALSSPSALAVSVPFTVSGTATNPSDHGASSGTLNFSAGQMNASYSFFIAQDSVTESNETVILTLGTPANATLGTNSAQTITISDSAPASMRLGWILTNQTSSEGESITIQAALNTPATNTITAPISISGTATSGSDYTITPSTISIPAGSSRASVTISLLGDAISEPVETLILSLGTPSGAGLERGKSSFALNISDSTPIPVASFDITGFTFDGVGDMPTRQVMENAGSIVVSARLSAPSSQVVTLPYFTEQSAGGRFGIGPGSITIQPGQTSGSKTIPLIDNTTLDSFRFTRVYFIAGQPTNATLGNPSEIQIQVLDNERPVLSFAPVSRIVSEGEGTVTLQASLSIPLPGTSPVTLNLTADSNSSTATAGSDYNLISSTLTFQPGGTQASATISLVEDTTSEPAEFIQLRASGMDPIQVDPAGLQISIRDNDGAASVAWGNIPGLTGTASTGFTASISESAGTVQIPAFLSNAQSSAVTIPVNVTTSSTAVSGTDYSLPLASISFPAGSTVGSLNLNLINNTTFTGARNLRLQLAPPAGVSVTGTSNLNISIIDDDAKPTIQFTSSGYTFPENVGSATGQVQLSALSAISLTTNVVPGMSNNNVWGNMRAGSDYTAPSANVIQANIPAGSLTANFPLQIINDSISEDEEFVGLAFSGSSGDSIAPPVGMISSRITITDDDPLPTVQWDSSSQTALESAGRVTITASVTPAAGKTIRIPYTVSGTARFGSDHMAANAELIIPEGATSGSIDVAILSDLLSEGSETIVFTLVSGGTGNANLGSMVTHTLTLNDAAAATWTQAAFQATVYPLVTANCAGCHGASGAPRNFADPNITNAFNAARVRANWDNIPASLLAERMSTNHYGGIMANQYYNQMITALNNWKAQSGGSSGGGGTTTPLADGTAGIQDYIQFEASLNRAIEGFSSTLSNGADIIRLYLSPDGDPTDVSPPMVGGYISMASEYCVKLVGDVFGNSPNKRGFDLIAGLSNFSIPNSSFTTSMQDQVTQRMAQMFWQRQATASEIATLQTLVTELKVITPGISTRDLGIAMCTAIAGAPESFDTN